MKAVFKIAKAELKYLFYSPIAWFIFIIFAVQAGLLFADNMDWLIRSQLLGYERTNLTLRCFYGRSGFFSNVQSYLYLYIPLLTMGIMSREYSSGSIKLLYSSPVSNTQIIMGKYVSLLVYCLSIIGILIVYSLFSVAVIEHVDIPIILSGLLGIFLLICAYSAIGLFVSSLTSYQVVAAIGTLAILALMNYIKGVGQEIPLVRDITYWFAMPGRSDTFIAGLIGSEDVIYFIAIIFLFVSLTIVQQKGKREKRKWYLSSGRILAILGIVVVIGFFTSKPSFKKFYDVTRTKQNTLTQNSQDIISQLDGGLTITTYVNLLDEMRNYWAGLPRYVKRDMERYEQYLRFKPETGLKYVYYYHRTDNPHLDVRYPGLSDEERIDTLRKLNNWKFPYLSPEEVAQQIDLSKERFRFVSLVERETGEKTFLRIFDDRERFPSEREVSAALKRLVMGTLPTVGFVTGHQERNSNDGGDRGYKIFAQERGFRYALINQGFDFLNISLAEQVPSHVRMLVIAEPRNMFSPIEMEHLEQYVNRGDNLLILGEPGREEFVNPLVEKLGVRFLPGTVVKTGRVIESETALNMSETKRKVDTIPEITIQPELMMESPTDEATQWSYHLKEMGDKEYLFVSPTFSALEIDSVSDFVVTPLFVCRDSWIEIETKNLIDDMVVLNPEAGEMMGDNILAVALSRIINGKEQRVVVVGDADWLSNRELGITRNKIPASNFHFINASFFWLSDDEVPVDIRRPALIDNQLRLTQSGWAISSTLIKWIYPLILLIIGLLILIRRRGR